MNKSESIQLLASALSKAQAELPAIKFDSKNPFLKNDYASLGAIIAGARPIIAKHGLSVAQLTFGEDGVAGVETVLMHASGEWISNSISMPIGEEKGKSSAQVAGSIVTYLRRYSLASILGIYSDEDGDGNKPEPERKPTRTALPKEDPLTDFLVETFAVDAPVKVEAKQTNNGNKWARPMSPEVLKEALQIKSTKANPATEKQINLTRVLLLEHFADREDERHQAQEYLTGHKSFKDIEPTMISAILDWLKPEKATDGSGAYVLGKDAKVELTMVARKFMEDLGQQALAI